MIRFFFFCCLLFSPLLSAQDQDSGDDESIKVFLDCKTDCDYNYIRTEIGFVDYVTDRTVADLHVLITRERTGAGGNAYQLDFIGRKRFDGQGQKLQIVTGSGDTTFQQRSTLTNVLKAGLIPYTVGTTTFHDMQLLYQPSERKPLDQEKDKWNRWTFSISGTGNLQSETNYARRVFQGNFSASKVTKDWKINLNSSSKYDKTVNVVGTTTYNNVLRNKSVGLSTIRSVNDHWSAKIAQSVSNSTYDNIDRAYRIELGTEYSVYPYRESARRALKVQYEPSVHWVHYNTRTIYEKDKEQLFQESLTGYLGLQQPWGSASINMKGSHYFHDISKFRLTLGGGLDWRITRGLSAGLNGSASYIRDQLNISSETLTPDQIFLRLKQQATNYSYRTELRLTYRFGSFVNNTVNTRFDER